ncbi:17137_t:CDS:1, partial [Entrophospora sp. SA101]
KTTKKVTTTSSSTVTQSCDTKGEGITSGVTSTIGSTFSGFFGKHDTKSVETTKTIISKQTSEGSFHISDTLSEILEISSDTKSQSFTSTIQTYAVSERLKKTTTHYTWWTTAITISYLRIHASSHETTWKVQYEKARKYLSEQIKDVELEEELLKTCTKIVEEKTTKKVTATSSSTATQSYDKKGEKKHEEHEGIVSGVTSTIGSTFSGFFGKHDTKSVETTKTIISKQTSEGSFHISDTLSEILEISSDTKSQSFTSTIQTYAVSERLKKTTTHYTWWTTAITISYLRLHASSHETTWKVQYEKARKYLSEQIKDVELEEELLKTCTKIVEEKTTKKVTTTSSSTATQSCDTKGEKKHEEEHESIIGGVTSSIGSTFSGFFGKHDTKSVETTKTIISKQTSEGSFHISDTLSEILEISSDTKSQSFTSTIQTYAVSERLKKTTTHYTWWTTAITISYLKLHASSHETTWKVQYEKARKYLSEQIKDVELEEELLKTCTKIVEEKTTKKVTTTSSSTATQSYDKKGEKKHEEEGIVSGVASSIGSTFSGFFGKHDTKSVETTKTIISKQTSEGSFHISDTLSEILEISSDTKSQSFTSTIQTYAVSERLKKTTTHYTWWTTAITISYLRLHASSHETTWKVQYEKARKYLSEQINDVELEEELLKTCTKIVEEKTTKKVTATSSSTATQSYDKKGEGITSGVTSTIGSTFSGFFGKHDTKSVETTKTVISKQTSEGSFHISDTLSEILDISSDTKSQSFTSTIQTYAVSERLKKTTTHYTWWTTAITISYLKIHASSHETTWKVQYEKARKYLSEQINDVELEEELLKTCSKIVEEKTTKKVTTDTKVIAKEHEGIVSGVTSTIGSTFSGFFGKHDTKSVETTKTVISKQNNEGSFCISDTLSEILDISSDTKSQSFTSTIQTYAVSERLKKTTTHTTWWTTAITISYLKIHASSHETTWKVQYEKARKYLSEQINDVELEEELLKTCSKIVEEKTTKKVTTDTKVIAKEHEGIVSGVTSTIGSTFSGFFGKHDTKSVETTKTVISKQNNEGSFCISDTLSEILDISSDTKSQSFTSTIQTYAVSERLKKTTTHTTWWTTAITISYLKIHASSHETTWKVQYEKARKYLSEQIKDVELEEELLKTCSKIVEEKTTKKVTTDTKVTTSSSTVTQSHDKKGEKKHEEHESIIGGVTSTIGSTFSGFFGKHDTKSVETTKTIISKQTNEGSFCISDTLSEILEISSDTKSQSFESTIETYAVSKSLKKTTKHTTWWTTAITISYLKLHASSHETTWKVQYEKARKYLSEQIKDVELEEELLKTCSKIVEEKTTKKVTTDTKVTTSSSTVTQSHDKKGEKKQEEHESIIGGVTSTIGSTFSGFFGKHDTKSVETTKTIISKQTNEGSFHISDTLSEILEISSDTKSQSFESTIETYAVSKSLKKTTKHTTWWTTAITISYLKLHASSHETTWKVQYEKARKYLSEQIKDVELEEELLKTCSKIVEEKTTKKVTTTSSSTVTQSCDTKGEKKHEEEGIVSGVASSIGSTFSGFFGKHDTKSVETTKTIISKQTNEGSFQISDTLSEILEISSDTKSQSFESTIETYAVSKSLKKTTKHTTWWTTAITISYLKLHASSHETTWKVQYEKARKYLSEQIKD